MKYVLAVLPFIFLSSCASKGWIKESISPDYAVIKVGEDKLATGDKVTVVDRECVELERRNGMKQKCTDRTVGQAEVTEVREASNEAVIRRDGQTPLSRGYMIEKVIRVIR